MSCFEEKKQILDQFSLPGGHAAVLKVHSDLGVLGNTVVETHHLGVAAEHRLVLHEHALHATVHHHVTPHHLQDSKKYCEILNFE